MWFIEGQVTRRGRQVNVRTWLKPGTTLTLGRQDNDPDVLCVGTDVNVSRRHVALTVEESSLANVTTRASRTTLIIKDLSQNGVFLDGVRIKRQEDTPLQLTHVQPRRQGGWGTSKTIAQSQIEAEDQGMRSTVAGSGHAGSVEMTIGSMKFTIERVDFSVAFAGMSSSEKVEASQLAADIDIKVEPKEWVSGVSTHLLMSSASSPRAEQFRLSDKVYQALAYGGHIITMPWLQAFRDALLASTNNRYEPFDPPSESEYLPMDFKSLAQVSGIQWYPDFKRKMGYRWVETREIGMAILAVSTDQFCNPKYQGTLPTLDDRLTHASMSSLSTFDPRQSSLMQPLPEESATLPVGEGRPGTTYARTLAVDMGNEDEPLLPSLGFDDFFGPRRGKTSGTGSSSTSTTTATKNSPVHATPTRLAAKPTKVAAPPSAIAAPSKLTIKAGDGPKKKSRLDMFLDEEDDVIIMDPAPQALKSPTPVVANQQQRHPTVSVHDRSTPSISRVSGTPLSPTSTLSTSSPRPGAGATAVHGAGSERGTVTPATGARRKPILLDSDDDFDFGFPTKRSQAKKDDSRARQVVGERTAALVSVPDGDETFVSDKANEKQGSESAKSTVATEDNGGKRRKILLSKVDSPPSKVSDMFDDLGDDDEEVVDEKPLKPASTLTKEGRDQPSGKTGSSSTTATVASTGRKKLDPVHQDISTYHIEDMIHHQRELERYHRQEAELKQQREMDRLEREYERAASVRPETTAQAQGGGRSNDSAHRAAETGKKQPTALMTSVFSDRLLDNRKRLRLLTDDKIKQEEEDPGIVTPDTTVSSVSSLQQQQRVARIGEQVASMSLREHGSGGEDSFGEHPEWPERWKKMPNYKTRPPVDPVLVEKWKGRPNFKAFRRTAMPGVPMVNGPPVPLMTPQQ
ncbi:hypothetical protein BGZ73_008391 [Actinomortierella ambigua]|nr:hypothetical protein BGZ73_008391 [Actinomortierella ambigua]